MAPRTQAVALFAAALFLAVPALSQEYATVRDVAGKAFVQAGDEKEPQPLVRNMPLTDGDSLWTDAGSRTGLMLKDGNRLWLDESSRLEATEFPGVEGADARTLRARLWKGSVLLDIAAWNGRSEKFFIETPSASFSAGEEGLFLLQIETVDRTRVTALRGKCSVSSGGESVELDTGQTTYAEYGYPPLAPALADLALSPGVVEYRNTCSRSLRVPSADSPSRKHLDPDLYAYAPDLDEGGSWTSVDGYGDCWVPEGVDDDWSPYSSGQWSYTSWGMTWVPYEPWGWLPFHYGSWLFGAGIGWAWYPGSIFAPAWCSWYWGADYLGWCPLDRWGYPLWGNCGWYSCGFNSLYSPNCPVVRHRTAPPPNPIYPRPHGAPGTVTRRPGEPRVGTGSRGPALRPGDVRAYNRGNLSADVLKKRAATRPDRGGRDASLARNPGGRSDGTATHPGRGASDWRSDTRSRSGSEARGSETAGVNPRRSWSPAAPDADFDSTRRSQGSSPGGAEGRGWNPGTRGHSPERNPSAGRSREGAQAPSYRPPDRGYSGRNNQPRTRPDGGYGSSDPRARDRSYGGRTIPSRPPPPSAPREGYSRNRGYDGSGGNSYSPRGRGSSPPYGGNSQRGGGQSRGYSAPRSGSNSAPRATPPSSQGGGSSSGGGSRGGSSSGGGRSGGGNHSGGGGGHRR